jgi:phytoene dehydrogenase-like protein
MDSDRVIVVGGGIAGLTAAAYVTRAGREVVLYERSAHLGGRGATTVDDGFYLNLGPHAVYKGGALFNVFADLGLRLSGARPKTDGGLAILGGEKHALPAGATTILTTGLFSVAEKVEAGAFFAGLGRINTRDLQGLSVGEWANQRFKHQRVRDYVLALTRVSTYSNAPDWTPASIFIEGMQGGLEVLYLDGGWQQMTDALRSVTEGGGGRIETGARVDTVETGAVQLAGGRREEAGAVILAVTPEAAAGMLTGVDVSRLIPLKMASLDLGLRQLPSPGRNFFALGIDQPLYMSVHSSAARLAPDGAAVIHVGKYLPAGQASDPAADERELEGLMDLVHPGWRAVTVQRRYLPSLTVVGAMPDVRTGGLAGRPGVETATDGVYLAGDWVGDEGTLSNASAASGRKAAALALERLAHAGKGALAAV